MKSKIPGIESRRSKAGAWSYRAKLRVGGERLSSGWLASENEAVRWKLDTAEKGARTGGEIPLGEAWSEWIALAEDGIERNRSGGRYKPSVLRGYRQVMASHVLPSMASTPLAEVTVPVLTVLVDRLKRQGLGASTIRNALIPVRCVVGRAVREGALAVNGTIGVRLPAVRGKRVRVMTPEQVRGYIEAAPEVDRGIWATALYTGLRRGEIGALRWSDVDLVAGAITVSRSWDWPESEAGEPKSEAGSRTVPLTPPLAEHLARQGLDGRTGDDLVFGVSARTAFAATSVGKRARMAWKDAGLEPLTLHECRHVFASLAIAGKMEPKALQVLMGHSSITITLDRYSHLMKGATEAAGALLAEAFA